MVVSLRSLRDELRTFPEVLGRGLVVEAQVPVEVRTVLLEGFGPSVDVRSRSD